jgi:translation initiation factor 2 beta subunit (eIF-2beta)/eIF-5
MIENLDNYYKGWLNHIEKTTFHFDKILKNTEIINFVEMALLDFMIIRNWEFGKFFIQEFSKIIIDSTTLERNSLSIKRALEKENDYLKKIGEKILESDENLETNESLLLVITLQERIIKNTVLRYSYTLTSYIVRENALELSLKIDTYKKTLSKSLNLKWSIDIDKGKGKGRGRGR